ncbi:hypothetical protein [Hadaka virus 1]|nr:hypothetical protein [Hadaka virus 1]
MSSLESVKYPGVANHGLLNKFLDEYGADDGDGHRVATNISNGVPFILGPEVLDEGNVAVVDSYIIFQSFKEGYGIYYAVVEVTDDGPDRKGLLEKRVFDGVFRLIRVGELSGLAGFARVACREEGESDGINGSLSVPVATILMSSMLEQRGLEGFGLSDADEL